MLKISIKKTNSHVAEIIFLGHAMYDDYGKDIVCAAASSILTTSVNSILALEGNENSLTLKQDKDKITVVITKPTDINQKLIKTMLDLLKDLEQNYPKNIKIN
ncbi:MAG: ribosomal-processing cysteine protease Prp [Bacilli bacterium]